MSVINKKLAELLGLHIERVHGPGPQHRLRDPRHGGTWPLRFSAKEAWDKDCPRYDRDACALLREWFWVMNDKRWISGPVVSAVCFDYRDNGCGEYFANIWGNTSRGFTDGTGRTGRTELEARINCLVSVLEMLNDKFPEVKP